MVIGEMSKLGAAGVSVTGNSAYFSDVYGRPKRGRDVFRKLADSTWANNFRDAESSYIIILILNDFLAFQMDCRQAFPVIAQKRPE
jgi:hypothetical protein